MLLVQILKVQMFISNERSTPGQRSRLARPGAAPESICCGRYDMHAKAACWQTLYQGKQDRKSLPMPRGAGHWEPSQNLSYTSVPAPSTCGSECTHVFWVIQSGPGSGSHIWRMSGISWPHPTEPGPLGFLGQSLQTLSEARIWCKSTIVLHQQPFTGIIYIIDMQILHDFLGSHEHSVHWELWKVLDEESHHFPNLCKVRTFCFLVWTSSFWSFSLFGTEDDFSTPYTDHIYSDVRHEGFTYCIMAIITEGIKTFVTLQQV